VYFLITRFPLSSLLVSFSFVVSSVAPVFVFFKRRGQRGVQSVKKEHVRKVDQEDFVFILWCIDEVGSASCS
jgi:hypothetical protein